MDREPHDDSFRDSSTRHVAPDANGFGADDGATDDAARAPDDAAVSLDSLS